MKIRVNVSIVITAISGIRRNVRCLVRNLKPTTVDLINIDSVHSLALARSNIDQDDLENVADTVGLLHNGLITGPKEVVDDTVVIRKSTIDVDRKDILLGNVVKQEINDWVVSTCLGILDLLDLGIGFLALFRVGTTRSLDEELNRKLGDASFIGPQEAQVLAILRPPGSTAAAKNLFLIHPVRDTVEILRATILGDLNYVLLIIQASDVQVVILCVGHSVALGTPCGKLDSSIGLSGHERLSLLSFDIKNKIDGAERVAPVFLLVDTEQNLLQIRAGLVPIGCVLVSVMNKEVILHKRSRFGSLDFSINRRPVFLVFADILYNNVWLLTGSNLEQQAILSIRTCNPADAVRLGLPATIEKLIHGNSLPRASRCSIRVVFGIALMMV
ncbi:hypothetical protein HG531_002926 [Fusarium graminearum]|nr:hypothetical protein HG531_002926 [Fusarium graminearum]